jgi:hypothetical protein
MKLEISAAPYNLDINILKVRISAVFVQKFACGMRQHLLLYCAVCSLNEMLQAQTC